MTKLKPGTVVIDYDDQEVVVLCQDDSSYMNVKCFDPVTLDVSYKESYALEKTKQKPWKAVTIRADGYYGAAIKRGSTKVLTFGCQVFFTMGEARKHWSNGPKGDYYEEIQGSEMPKGKSWREKTNTKHLAAVVKLNAKLMEKA